jgi:hypothetical protein
MSDLEYIIRRLPACDAEGVPYPEATVPPRQGSMEMLIAHYAESFQQEFKDWIVSLGKTMDEITYCEGTSEPPSHRDFTVSARFMVAFADGSKHEKVFSQDTLKDHR